MGFKEKLRLRDLLSFLTAPSRKSLIYVIDDDDNSTVPATKSMFGGGSGGGGTDPDSAREATLAEVLTHAQAINDNTSILASQTQGNGLHVLPPVSIEDYPPQQLNVGVETGLAVPAGATHALVSVAQGQVRIGLRDTVNGLLLGAGDTYTLTGSQLASFRTVYAGSGGVDALVRVDYWREGHAAVTL